MTAHPPLSESPEIGEPTDGLFSRKATGLLRELSLRDTILLNLGYISFPLGFLLMTQLGGLFPGASAGWAFLIAGLIAIPHLLSYGLFSSIMPRSGGDYLFIGRALHPMLGFVANALYTVFQVFGTAFVAVFVPQFALPAFFQTMALVTGSDWWTGVAADVSGKTASFAIAAAIVVVTGVLAMVSTRLLVRVFTVLMALSIGGVLVTIGSLLLIDSSEFAANFEDFGGSSVADVVREGKAADAVASTSLGATVASVAIVFATMGAAQISTYFGGEVRRASRSMTVSILGAAMVSVSVFALVAFLLTDKFGLDFIQSANALSAAGDEAWPFGAPPFINLLIGIGAPHSWLAVLLGVSYVAGVAALTVPTFLLATRNIFAHAFDRVLPSGLAEVNPRTHTPVVATAVVIVLMVAFLAGFVFSATDVSTYLLVSQVAAYSVFLCTAVAAIVFPYRRRALYEASPIKAKVLGLPLLTATGLLQATIMVGLLGVLLFSTYADAIGATDSTALRGLGILAVILAAVWVLAWARSRRAGLALTEVQRELPPE